MRRILAALLLACPALCQAQSVTLPAEIKGAVGQFVEIAAVSDDATIKWHSVDAGLNLFPQRLLKDTKIAVVTALVPGRYRVMAVSAKGDVPSDFALCTVVIGNPGPGPQPPEPPVPPGPEPPPNPPSAGPKNVLLFYESSEMTPQLSSLRVSLVNPSSPICKHLSENRHTVFSLDDDSPDSSDAKVLADWAQVLSGLTLPVLVIQDKKTGKVLHKQSIDAAKATGHDVLTILKPFEGQ